ncbi:MAG: hypothetical protein ACYDBJ_05705 [Aggregatilineales bacterium]
MSDAENNASAKFKPANQVQMAATSRAIGETRSTSEIKYCYAPPTATLSATVTLTATAILPTVGISGITQQDAQHFIFKIDVTNPTLIGGYRLEFVDQKFWERCPSSLWW